MKNILILFFAFYFLTLFQTSFLIYFSFRGFTLNLVLILIILLNIFEKPSEKLGLLSAFIGGFFLDIFSENFIGFWILILLSLAIFIKFILKRYLRLPIFQRLRFNLQP